LKYTRKVNKMEIEIDPKKREELQNLLASAESYRKQLESISVQLQMFESAKAEIEMAKEAITTLSKKEKDTKVLVPVGAETFFEGKIVDNSKVIVGVGANVFIEKAIEEAIQSMERRKEKIDKTMGEFLNTAREIESKLEEVNAAYLKILREIQEQQKEK